jgi:general secretion pathway protein G
MTPHARIRSARRPGTPARRVARRAFTLLEVIVAVTIVALLATLVVPRLFGQVGKAKTRLATNQAATLAQTVRIYLNDTGLSKPSQDFDLTMLRTSADPYLENDDDLVDPWGNQYVIIIPGQKNIDFDIVSYGADGEPGGEGEDEDVIQP